VSLRDAGRRFRERPVSRRAPIRRQRTRGYAGSELQFPAKAGILSAMLGAAVY